MQGRMFEMTRACWHNNDNRMKSRFPGNTRGFTMLEIVMVLLVGTVLTVMAIPKAQSEIYRYRLQGAVASSTWAIQSTRYQALMEGYPYQVVFTSSNASYQIQNLPAGATVYANVGTAVPLSGSAVTLNQNTTLQFKPDGFVLAPVGALNFTITYQGICQRVTVTNYANITLSAIGATC